MSAERRARRQHAPDIRRPANVTERDAEQVDSWAEPGSRFVGLYETLYGQVRTHVLHAHLREHLPPAPARLVDIGGGAGHQAIALARDGYDVTIVDSSPAMLERAAARLKREDPEVAARVRLVSGDGVTARETLAGSFAGVLCHGVLGYLDDPEPLVATLCSLAAAEGVVSIMTKNARTLAVRPGLEGDWDAALNAFDATTEINKLGLATRADTPEELAKLLEAHGVIPVAWYGVRCFTEGWGRARPRTDSAAAVLAVELEASRRDPYRQVSRCFHLLGTRELSV
jgi:SAM-dependent methyltransferase